MPEYRTVCKLADVPDGLGHTVYIGDFALALFRVNGQIHAIDDTCPHMGASLGSGFVENGTVTCPWHEGVFSLDSGRVLSGPPVHPVATYQVKLDGDTILIAHEGGAREPAVS